MPHFCPCGRGSQTRSRLLPASLCSLHGIGCVNPFPLSPVGIVLLVETTLSILSPACHTAMRGYSNLMTVVGSPVSTTMTEPYSVSSDTVQVDTWPSATQVVVLFVNCLRNWPGKRCIHFWQILRASRLQNQDCSLRDFDEWNHPIHWIKSNISTINKVKAHPGYVFEGSYKMFNLLYITSINFKTANIYTKIHLRWKSSEVAV